MPVIYFESFATQNGNQMKGFCLVQMGKWGKNKIKLLQVLESLARIITIMFFIRKHCDKKINKQKGGINENYSVMHQQHNQYSIYPVNNEGCRLLPESGTVNATNQHDRRNIIFVFLAGKMIL